MSDASSPVYRLRNDVRFRRVEDEGVVLVQENNEILGVSAVGIRFLELVDGRTGLDGIVERLLEELDVERALLEGDVNRFAGELLAAGVLVEVRG